MLMKAVDIDNDVTASHTNKPANTSLWSRDSDVRQ